MTIEGSEDGHLDEVISEEEAKDKIMVAVASAAEPVVEQRNLGDSTAGAFTSSNDIVPESPAMVQGQGVLVAKSSSSNRDWQASTSKEAASFSVPRNNNHKKSKIGIYLMILVVIVIVITLAVVLTRKDDEQEEDPFIYSTGVSLISYYGVNASITSRLAQTTITMDVMNALNCSAIHRVTMQLPLGTRVASLQTITEEGCITHGQVKELQDARDTFMEATKDGLPTGYVEQQDSFSYGLQVSIPPSGVSRVELVVEALLQQRSGEINFEIPLLPNEKVDRIAFDLNVRDIDDLTTTYHLDLGIPELNQTIESFNSTFSIYLPNARQFTIPTVIRGRFKPMEISNNGALSLDGTCFEHYFLPTSLQPMKRNLVFLLDLSGYNEDQFVDAKAALGEFIDTLTPQDSFTVQTFARVGTRDFWRSVSATDDEKIKAKAFLNSTKLEEVGGSDLHEALLLGLLRAKSYDEESGDDTITVLFLLLQGWAGYGETNRGKIAENVFQSNNDGKIKIFALGYEGYSDLELLNAIAIMNGGVAASIVSGSTNYKSQISNFLESEFGTILLSDVEVRFEGTVHGVTQQKFPVLADGYEVVVRGLLDESASKDLRAVTAAETRDGKEEWSVNAVPYASSMESSMNSRCFQSYAHDRITQLLQFREATKLVPERTLKKAISLSNCPGNETLADCMRKEALDLAIKANLVTKSLTAMVTVDEKECLSFEGETEICLDGTIEAPRYERAKGASDDGYYNARAEGDFSYGGYDYDYQSSTSRNFQNALICFAVTFLVSMMLL